MNGRKVNKPTDPRVERSTQALGEALIALLHERQFDDITVQDILDRAGVGRATFYAHYRNKDDVLHSGYEQMFGYLAGQLDRDVGGGPRLVPVKEFLAHVGGEASVLLASLQASGKMDELSDVTVGYIADMIKQRMAPVDAAGAAVPAALLARMLAAAFVEMFRWWLEQPVRETPERMDAVFHAMAETMLYRSRYAVVAVPHNGLGSRTP